EGYSSKTHEKQTYLQAEKLLTDFWQNYQKEKPNTVGIEQPFSFWLAHSAGSGQDKIKAGGRIDRVDKLAGDKIEIIDYKTGKNMLDEKKAKDDLQLSFYALAATEVKDSLLGKTPEQIVLTLHYLEANQKVSTTRSKKELEIAKAKIMEIVSEIENSDFQCTGGMQCKNCEYKILCDSNK
ncbi:MAG TPA: PD-(D/E)XK nuclease family protein, partial [Xanthomonadales bacterium]|nr:PD-(D/E)XK nuclease family protein [Xanthomonadales bacterium]